MTTVSQELSPARCDMDVCLVPFTAHGHMPADVRESKPENNLCVSNEAKDIAKFILSIKSYDGLTLEQLKSNEALLGCFTTEAVRIEPTFVNAYRH